MYKICSKCKEEKPATSEYYYKSKHNKGGLDSQCKECRKTYRENYLSINKEHVYKNKKAWISKNKEKYKLQRKKDNAKYILKNRDKRNEYNKRWAREHRDIMNKNQLLYLKTEKGKITEKKRQYKRRCAKGSFTYEQWEDCKNFFDNKCAYTGVSLTEETSTIDHIVPISKTGSNNIWNICPSINYANFSKNNSNMEEWYKKQDYYSEERLNKIYNWMQYSKEKYYILEHNAS